jgi:hypothetical protein
MKQRILFTVACTVAALLGASTVVQARSFPTWDRLIEGAGRFKVIMDGKAALDKETGLVWELTPDTVPMIWSQAQMHCFSRRIGIRFGFRVPTSEELTSLVTSSFGPSVLPAGHPFVGVAGYYWSATTNAFNASNALAVFFDGATFAVFPKTQTGVRTWCVRGQQGLDGR